MSDCNEVADLKPSPLLAHPKQAVPEEANLLLYQQEVDTEEHAFEILTVSSSPSKLVNPYGRNPEYLPTA